MTRELCDASEEGEKSELAERDGVAGGGQGGEITGGDAKSGAEMAREGGLGAKMIRQFDGRELPHAREEDSVVVAGRFCEKGAAARIEENRGGDAEGNG